VEDHVEHSVEAFFEILSDEGVVVFFGTFVAQLVMDRFSQVQFSAKTMGWTLHSMVRKK
jgi:hypothetical protein